MTYAKPLFDGYYFEGGEDNFIGNSNYGPFRMCFCCNKKDSTITFYGVQLYIEQNAEPAFRTSVKVYVCKDCAKSEDDAHEIVEMKHSLNAL